MVAKFKMQFRNPAVYRGKNECRSNHKLTQEHAPLTTSPGDIHGLHHILGHPSSVMDSWKLYDSTSLF